MSDKWSPENKIENETKRKSENQIENELLQQLVSLGYKKIDLPKINFISKSSHIKPIEENFKKHFYRLNQSILKGNTISDENFNALIFSKIRYNSFFQNAEFLRYGVEIPWDNGTGNWRLYFYDAKNLENNVFEIAHQIKQDTELGNICDVTIFMNGLPIVQIELKKSGIEIDQAYRQMTRYKREAFDHNIYKMCQLFIVSNYTYTKYFSNNNRLNKNYCFNWTNENNIKSKDLTEFCNDFLNKETLFKMINEYMIINSSDEEILTLRPYQYHAVESVLNFVKENNELNNTLTDLEERSKKLNAYIWHATGSGKTVTSFKIADILKDKDYVEKVIFLVDRNDLNKQTNESYKKYLGVDGDDLQETVNSSQLQKQLLDEDKNKLIITTMQKMDKLLKDKYFVNNNRNLFTKNYIFIVDECHRTQFGLMNDLLRKTFIKSRFIGFTGTPIFADDGEKNNKVTSEIFGKCLHKYLMKDAIKDENILPFTIEYIRVFKPKNNAIGFKTSLEDNLNEDQIKVQAIDKKEVYYSDEYIKTVAEQIKKDFDVKTHHRKYKAMLVCKDIETAIKYHNYFRENIKDIKIATLFSKVDNNEFTYEDEIDSLKSENVRSKLVEIINDYNQDYNTQFDYNNFKAFSNNVQDRIKDKNVDQDDPNKLNLIIVVRMLTTGFDAKNLNTIYLDRNIRNYELIQTISRTNRVLDSLKTTANIVSFCTPSKNVDAALAKYNDGDMVDVLFNKGKLEEYINDVNNLINDIKKDYPTYDVIKNEESETSIQSFIAKMKKLNKFLNVCQSFIYFDFSKIIWSEVELYQYRDVQKELSKRVEKEPFKYSVLNQIDFGIDILREDEINVDYILNLLKEDLRKAKNDVELRKKVNEIIEKHAKRLEKTLETLFVKWINEIALVNISEIKDLNLKESFNEFLAKSIREDIEAFSQENGCDRHKIAEICWKVKTLDKNIEACYDDIEKAIINFDDKGLLERIAIQEKVTEFIQETVGVLKDTNLAIDIKSFYKN